jgi:ribosomal protein S6--L-glutamate ligase
LQAIALLTREPGTYDSRSILAAITKAGFQPVTIDYTDVDAVSVLAPGKFAGIIPRHTPRHIEAVARLVETAEGYGLPTVASARAIRSASVKLETYHILKGAGIDLPKTVALGTGGVTTAADIRREFGSKCVVKPSGGAHGQGVELVSCEDEGFDLSRFIDRGVDFIAQEYIEESHGEDVRVIVVGGKAVAGMIRASADGSLQSNLHHGGKAKPVKLSTTESDIAVRAAQALGLGFGGVDILRSNRGPLVLEVNSSPGLLGIERSTGIDIAGKVISYVSSIA